MTYKIFRTLGMLTLMFSTTLASAALYTEHPVQTGLLNDNKLHIYLCGTGQAEIAMQDVRKPACVAVIGQGEFLLFDAGEGATQTLARLGLPIQDLNQVFITHWHSDHFGGLGQIMNASWNAGRTKQLPVMGPWGVKEVVAGLNQAYTQDAGFRAANSHDRLNRMDAFANPREIRSSDEGKLVFNEQGIKVYAFTDEHPPVTAAVGYRIEDGACHVTISGDTQITAALAANSQNADVLISDVLSDPLYQQQWNAAQKSQDQTAIKILEEFPNTHPHSLALAKMAEQEHVKMLVLTHLIPAIPDTAIAAQQFTQGMERSYTGNLIVPSDGDEITVYSDPATKTCQTQYIKVTPFSVQPLNPELKG